MKFNQFFVLVAIFIVIIGIWVVAPNIAYAMTPTPTITPTDLTATAVSPTQINLSWNAPTQNYGKTITGYKIEQRLSGGNYFTLVANTNRIITTYSLTGLTTGTTYTYRVSAVYSDDSSTDPSNAASATPTTTSVPPPTPSLTSPITNVKFDFTPSDGTTLTAVIITQSDYQQLQYEKNPRSIISNALPTSETITNDLAGILTYQNYHLSPASIPGPLIAKAVSPTKINLSWLPPLENYQQKIIGYKIDWKRVPGDYVIIDDNTGNDTTKYSIVDLKIDTTYTYRVAAIYSDHTTSNPSNEASAITLQSLQPIPKPTPSPTTPSPTTPSPTTTPSQPTPTPQPIMNVKFDFTASDGTTLTSVILTQNDYQQLIVIKDPRSLISNVTETTDTINNNLSGLLRYQTIHSSQETTPPQQTNYTPPAPNKTANSDNKLVDGVITAIVASGAVSVITWFVRTKIAKKIAKEYYFTLEKIIEDGTQHIRIRNSGPTIEDCIILCSGVACVWTDTKTDKPRHVYEGSISIVKLPNEFGNNPLISVKSGKKVLKKTQLDDMAYG
ncbi:MAG TPA: fibronectin type III domain-containing protein [Nitrosopumilaceae archaeon]|nr:fibronectin type III domain-containing protein [Nitrosopumilaceae archaeon]